MKIDQMNPVLAKSQVHAMQRGAADAGLRRKDVDGPQERRRGWRRGESVDGRVLLGGLAICDGDAVADRGYRDTGRVFVIPPAPSGLCRRVGGWLRMPPTKGMLQPAVYCFFTNERYRFQETTTSLFITLWYGGSTVQ